MHLEEALIRAENFTVDAGNGRYNEGRKHLLLETRSLVYFPSHERIATIYAHD